MRHTTRVFLLCIIATVCWIGCTDNNTGPSGNVIPGADQGDTGPLMPKVGGKSSNNDPPDMPTDMETGEVTNLSGILDEALDDHSWPAAGAVAFSATATRGRGVAGLREDGNTDAPVTRNDSWHLGQTSKALTAVLVARIIDQNTTNLAYDDTLNEIFPQYTLSGNYGIVTVEDLLRHEGGITSDLERDQPDALSVLEENANAGAARQQATSVLLQRPPDNTIGQQRYSDAGYIVLAAIAEQETNESFEELLQSEVFEPLDMSCGFGAPGSSTDSTPTQPYGHGRTNNDNNTPLPPGEDGSERPRAFSPALGVHCTLDSWRRLGQMLLGGGPAGYLSEKALTQLLTVQMRYALGFEQVSPDWTDSDDVLVHEGTNGAHYAYIVLDVDANLGVVVTTNIFYDDVTDDIKDVMEEVGVLFTGGN